MAWNGKWMHICRYVLDCRQCCGGSDKMTNDLISQAEDILGRLAALKEHAKLRPNAVIFEMIDIRETLIEMVPRLVAEIKRLGEIKETGPHAISVGGKTFLSADVDENRLKQLANKDTELIRWQQIAIDKLNEKDRYTEQLEKDFIFYARSYEYLIDPDKWKPHQERYAKAEQKAQDALNEIRKRK